ncbi:MAG: hypothetical protein MMC23_006255 [Stictis urceolatum]|nr:hypothetical protein [Stictis urceolata]
MFSNSEQLNEIYGAGRAFQKAPWYQAVASDLHFDFDLLTETDVEKYRMQRRLLGPLYAIPNVKKHEDKLDLDLELFFGKIEKSNGKPVDLEHLLDLFVIDTLARVTYGVPAGTQEADTDWGHMAGMEQMWSHVSWIGFYPNLGRWFKTLQRITATGMLTRSSPSQIFAFVFGQIGTHLSPTPPATPCVFRDLLNLHHTRPEFTLDWAQGMSLTDLGAGLDTVTWTLNTVITSIATHPHVLRTLLSEIDASVSAGTLEPHGTPASYDGASSLPYLHACMKETMRLYPSVGMPLDRIVPASCPGLVLSGHHIPPGTVVGMNSWVQGRSTQTYGADAESFRPERWIEASQADLNRMTSGDVTFGTMARSCPGRQLAWVLMSKMLASLFRDWRVEVLNELGGKEGPGGRKWRVGNAFVTRSVGVEVGFERRK